MESISYNQLQKAISYSQYIQKIKDKLCMKAINYACSRLNEEATKSVKKIKNSFINVIGTTEY